jgi:hypothetical protein
MDKWRMVFVIPGVMISTAMYCAEPYLSFAEKQQLGDIATSEVRLPDDGKSGWGPRWLNTHEITTQVATPSVGVNARELYRPQVQ